MSLIQASRMMNTILRDKNYLTMTIITRKENSIKSISRRRHIYSIKKILKIQTQNFLLMLVKNKCFNQERIKGRKSNCKMSFRIQIMENLTLQTYSFKNYKMKKTKSCKIAFLRITLTEEKLVYFRSYDLKYFIHSFLSFFL